jgi:hypothetical protein
MRCWIRPINRTNAPVTCCRIQFIPTEIISKPVCQKEVGAFRRIPLSETQGWFLDPSEVDQAFDAYDLYSGEVIQTNSWAGITAEN